jgi:hypothetical protein
MPALRESCPDVIGTMPGMKIVAAAALPELKNSRRLIVEPIHASSSFEVAQLYQSF